MHRPQQLDAGCRRSARWASGATTTGLPALGSPPPHDQLRGGSKEVSGVDAGPGRDTGRHARPLAPSVHSGPTEAFESAVPTDAFANDSKEGTIVNANFFAVIAACTLGGWLLCAPGWAEEIETQMTFSGAAAGLIDADGNPVGLTNSQLKGTFGRLTGHGVSAFHPWPNSGGPDPVPGPIDFCSPTEIKLIYSRWTSVSTTARGDQFYWELDPAMESFLCFNFLDFSSYFIIYTSTAGGTGRFSGATGGSVITGTAQEVQPNHTAFSGSSQGVIQLVDN